MALNQHLKEIGMTINQKKILVTLEGAVLGVATGFLIILVVYGPLNIRESPIAWAGLIIAGVVCLTLWFVSRMNGRMPGLDNLWDVLIGKEDDSPDGYAMAETEVNEGRQDMELWAKALIKAKGNEELRKVEYMKLRVLQLKNR